MSDIPKAMIYRRKAATCGRLARCAQSDPDRDRLLRMQESWLALAGNEDWLEGLAATAGDRAVAQPLT